jgi:hypothetical protein
MQFAWSNRTSGEVQDTKILITIQYTGTWYTLNYICTAKHNLIQNKRLTFVPDLNTCVST